MVRGLFFSLFGIQGLIVKKFPLLLHSRRILFVYLVIGNGFATVYLLYQHRHKVYKISHRVWITTYMYIVHSTFQLIQYPGY